LLLVGLLLAVPARAQEGDPVYADEPTGGLELPGAGLTGEPDAYAATLNPANAQFMRGPQLGALVNIHDEDSASVGGTAGVGLYAAGVLGGGVLPRLGASVGLEFLRSARVALSPDPGEATRLALGTSLPVGTTGALGVTWNHYFADDGQALDGVDTFDLGLTARFGPRFALGAAVRDVGGIDVSVRQPDGSTLPIPVQRRYEGELLVRPFADERVEVASGARIGETRGDVDLWGRFAARLTRGVYLRGEVSMLTLQRLGSGAVIGPARDEREWFASLGFEVSFGGVGVTSLATAGFGGDRDARFVGGSVYARASGLQVPSVLGPRRRMARVVLDGAVGNRRLTQYVLGMRQIRRDDHVAGVILQVDGVAAGWASVRELREQVLAMRAAGKKVFAYVVAGTMRDYYIASAADKVYVDPAGGLRIIGFSATTLYFKGLFERFGVDALFEKIQEYKSAPEAYTRRGPSEPALRMRNSLYDDMYGTIVEDIASSRKIAPERVRELVDRGPYTAGDLAAMNDAPLVDGVLVPEQLDKEVAQQLGGRLYPVRGPEPLRPEAWDGPRIAVVYLVGDIVDGQSRTLPVINRLLLGGNTIAAAIASARADPSIDAIVLRIDSPGGSALASEMIAREVFKTRGVKPILCSLGDVAASGGYFAAAGCDRIFADRTTVTGSIGIFFGKADISGLLRKMGLAWHTYRRGESADIDGYYRGYTDAERARLKKQIRYFYGRFVSAVSRGRELEPSEVDAVGRGRVWTGAQAAEVGLVDEIGGIADVLALAKARAGIAEDTPTSIVFLPQEKPSFLERLIGRSLPVLSSAADSDGLDPETELPAPPSVAPLLAIPDVRRALEVLPGALFEAGDVPQARLPFAMDFE